MKSCYIKGLLVSVLAFYPTFELSRIILSYLNGGYWITEPFTFATIIEGKPWSEWCYILEIGLIWFGYFTIIFLTVWWDRKLLMKQEVTI